MKINAVVRWLILASVSLVVAIALGVSIVVGSVPNAKRTSSAPDSTAIDRLTRSQFNTGYPLLAPSLTITETAAVLTAGLLVSDYDFRVDLPLVAR